MRQRREAGFNWARKNPGPRPKEAIIAHEGPQFSLVLKGIFYTVHDYLVPPTPQHPFYLLGVKKYVKCICDTVIIFPVFSIMWHRMLPGLSNSPESKSRDMAY